MKSSGRSPQKPAASMSADEPLVRLQHVSLWLPTDDGMTPVLHDVSLDVAAGEAVGVVGESGSGKSMTLRCITQTLPSGARMTGTVSVAGRDIASLGHADLRGYRRNEVGFIFQDPRSAINPVHTIGDFLLEPTRDRGEDVVAARARAVELLARMGVGDPQRRMAQYPFELSGGLLQRVMIASVLHAGPRLILADEPTTALDVTTQSDVLALTNELRTNQQTAMLFVTHDLDLALAVCSRIVVLYAGRVLEVASAHTVENAPLHPYTRALLASRPPIGVRLDVIPVIAGAPVAASEVGAACAFAARCPVQLPICHEQPPLLLARGSDLVACHRAEEIAAGELAAQLPHRVGSNATAVEHELSVREKGVADAQFP